MNKSTAWRHFLRTASAIKNHEKLCVTRHEIPMSSTPSRSHAGEACGATRQNISRVNALHRDNAL
jgi:hypothetical protein